MGPEGVTEIRNVVVVAGGGTRHVSIIIRDGKIQDIVDVRAPAGDESCAVDGSRVVVEGEGRLAVPGFIDVHLHGACGLSTMDGEVDRLRELSRTIVRWGVTSYCPTLMTAPREDLCRAVEAVAAAVEMSRRPDWEGAEVLGSHCEGPYFSKARRGAQSGTFLRNPDAGEVKELWEASRGTLRIFSLAPELPGAFPIIRWLAERGVTVSAGHSDAAFEEALLAIKAGITQSTHTFNGMRPMTHRDPGIVCAVLTSDSVDAEVIADGMHVHPGMVKLLVRAKGTDRVIAVSDLTHLAGLPPGLYALGDTPVEVTASGAFVRGTGGLAGSTSPLLGAFNNLLKWGFSLQDAICLTSWNAARKMGLGYRKGSVAPGMDADVVLLNPDGTVYLTMVRGRVVYRAGDGQV